MSVVEVVRERLIMRRCERRPDWRHGDVAQVCDGPLGGKHAYVRWTGRVTAFGGRKRTFLHFLLSKRLRYRTFHRKWAREERALRRESRRRFNRYLISDLRNRYESIPF